MATVSFKKMSRAAYEALVNKDNGVFYRVVNTDESEDFYLGAKKLNNAADITDAIEALDGSATIASKSGDVVTIKGGITEADGVVSNDSSSDIVLAAVATTGAAEDVSYDNTTSGLTATDVQGAIDEVAEASAGGVDSKTVWFTDNSAGQSDYAKVYKIWQGANSPESVTDPAALIGTINIPKDAVLRDASIVNITYDNGHLYDDATDVTELIKGEGGTATAADAGKYLKMEMQNVADPLYVNLQVFVDVYTVESGATEIQLALNDHEFSASVVSVDGSKIVYKAETSAGAGDGETVKQALTRLDGAASVTGSVAQKINTAITALDADLDASGTAQHSGVFVVSGVTEVDGVLTAVDSVEVEVAGAAAAAQSAAISTSEAYTDDAIESALEWEEV